jgi:hypothetical protein
MFPNIRQADGWKTKPLNRFGQPVLISVSNKGAKRGINRILSFLCILYNYRIQMTNNMQGLVQKADTIIVNAVIYTGNPLQPYAEAMAIAGESILLLGTPSSVEKLSNRQTQIIDAGKQFIYPGFIDAHLHFFMGGFNLTSVQLRSAPTPDEFIRRIAAFTKQIPKGTWITGGEWDHHNWGGYPARQIVDRQGNARPPCFYQSARRAHGLGQHTGHAKGRYRFLGHFTCRRCHRKK